MRRWIWLICGGLVLGSSTMASGQEPEPYPPCTKTPSKGDQEAAEGAFKAGFGSFQEGDYSKAILYWTDAYSRDCTAHALLLNLANAHERMGDRRKAVHALKVYLERSADVPNRSSLERRVANLEGQIAAEAPAPPPPTAKPLEEQKPAAAPVKDEPVKQHEGSKSIAPWIVVGAGGTVALVGGLIFLGGRSKVNDAEVICPDRLCPDTKEGQTALADGDDGRKAMTAGGILVGVGLVGVGAGLAWHFLWDKPDDASSAKPKTTLQPAVHADYAGLSFSGSF